VKTKLPVAPASAPDDREELARAEVYGLLAQLFLVPPSDELYAQLQVAPTEAPAPGGFLEAGWSELVAASRRLSAAQVRDEFDALFLGIGKPEVFVYASYFIAGALNERPLVALRHDLRALGLERPEGVLETEDHVSSLCEVMRYLIAADAVSADNLAGQQRFFNTHLRAWVDGLWDALAAHPKADFYRAVAAFARDFTAVEAQAFDLLDA
jgi:TorA maturation chaperone TorD